MSTKVCSKCGEDKPTSEFYKQSAMPDGLRYECKSCTKARSKKYAQKNKEKIKSYRKVYYQENKELVDQKNREYREKNKDSIELYLARYREENKEQIREQRRSSGKMAAAQAKRRVSIKQQTPSWANEQAIRAFYEEAARLTQETGIKHHVDHIIPRKGKLVSGLHVENNLQVIPANENLRKSNHYEVA